ncbi:hypothetical protein Back11_09300 [Paenibacillus baekrokdamisoli]|uniref:Uncharacterized protein n=1 Tax=Paenibacillus baekrokdamisoli TaxID=1712516 RepID=A0A3G9IU67_9BACL|nr:hypothetical protein [Paenibacillus baekrokdamisoli]MBB3067223.1 HSP20 family molecular chaperone IbpA [Paenibacillus baekrokdamisoli]BBH19585.1 hypothetical protein Back11_09300 [Paenibacillus baekrokdamisoli]
MNGNPNQFFDLNKFIQSFTGEETFRFSDRVDDKFDDTYPEHVGEYIQDMFSKVMPKMLSNISANMSPIKQKKVKTTIFESHRSVFVRWKVPTKVDPYQIRIHANTHHVRLSNLTPYKDVRINLPAQVTTRGCRANMQNGILEIRFSKSLKPSREKEIFLSELL